MGTATSGTELSFERTSLWQTAFRGENASGYGDVCDFYVAELRKLRTKAKTLVDRIRGDIPYLTVHDITHLDALWEIGSLLAGKSYPVTPAEGFVFGSAVLLHDAAMCLAAYPNGLEDLRKTDEWRDTIAIAMRQSTDEPVSVSDFSVLSDELLRASMPVVLRVLHARRAEELPSTKWLNSSNESEYLIDDQELRAFYGPVIGKIARSHGEPLSRIPPIYARPLGPMPSHDGGEVNALKLACLLRVADAAHLDARRAPAFEKTLVKPTATSDLHWIFQSKLAKPQLDQEALVFTSGSTFSLSEADAWWLCFDALQLLDRELRDVDLALRNTGLKALKASRVRGADSPRALARDIPTGDWDPIDTQLRVSDVQRLVRMFGGERLYGHDKTVAIRELIQNAADAIRARRQLQPTFARSDVGEVVIALAKRNGSYWLEVEDNGVGMSERTMTETLLDFGKSLWWSDAVQHEFPGLMAKGLLPTGKFGIGFFSVFMLGDIVTVTSRRYDAGTIGTRTLEFRGGLELRPILRMPTSQESIHQGGTKVAVRLREEPFEKNGLLAEEDWLGEVQPKGLGTVIGELCPSLDVSVFVVVDGRRSLVLRSDDWVRVKAEKLVKRIAPDRADDKALIPRSKRLRLLKGGKEVYGRACICAESLYGASGHMTVGGFSAGRLKYVEGILLGTTDALARDRAALTAPGPVLAQWAEEQADLIARSSCTDREKLSSAGVVIACGGDPQGLPIAILNGRYLSRARLEREIRRTSAICLFEGDPSFDEDLDNCHPRDFRNQFEPAPDVLFLGQISRWPSKEDWWRGSPSYWNVLTPILQRSWKQWEREETDRKVGEVLGEDIIRGTTVLRRTRR